MNERLAFNVGQSVVPSTFAAPELGRTGRTSSKLASKTPAKAEPATAEFTWTLIFTAILFLRPQDVIPPLEYLHLAEVSAICGLTALVLGRLRRGRPPIARLTPDLIGVLAFGAIILLTAPFSIWLGGSIGVFTGMYAKVILVYLLTVNV